MSQPKYSLLEIERRWLVPWEWASSLDLPPPTVLRDLYLSGTRLRLRQALKPGQAPAWKLCLKYPPLQPGVQPITNLYLEPGEAELLQSLPGARIEKLRHPWQGGSLDLYPSLQAALFEVEFPSLALAEAFLPPAEVLAEATGREEWSGAALAQRGAGLLLPEGEGPRLDSPSREEIS